MKKIFLYSLPLILIACGSDDEKKPEPAPQAPLQQSKNSEAFNKHFSNLLSSYYTLQAAFVKEDTVAVANAAHILQKAIDSLPTNDLKSDSSIVQTAKDITQNIADEMKGLVGEKDLEGKRKSFDMISNNIVALMQTVQYDREIVYKIHCPMAFNNRGADWLSNKSEVINPYLPKEMPDCGEVKDSIDFRKK